MSFDLLVKGAILPDGKSADIGITGETIAAIEPSISAEAGRDRRCLRLPRLAAFRRSAFPHGRDALLRHPAHQRVRHAARRHLALGRAEAALDPRGREGEGACATATGPSRWACLPSAPMSTSATTGCSPSRRCSRSRRRSRPTSTSSSSPSRRTASTARRRRAKTPSARSTSASTSSAASRISSAPWPTARVPSPNSARSPRSAA